MSVAEEIERLQALRDRGVLSEAEFAQAKARALGGGAGGGAGDGGAAGASGGATGSAAAAGASPATGPARAPGESFLHRLRRSTRDHVIGGVCGGLGEHTDLPSWAWRVIFCVAVLYFGVGLLLYLLLWVFIPAGSAQN
jgi:phage shock protein PspC (stress-responsive transcriptional regulator)